VILAQEDSLTLLAYQKKVVSVCLSLPPIAQAPSLLFSPQPLPGKLFVIVAYFIWF
jgi:hypothetical protein